MSLVRASATVGGMTFISRILGFLRDSLIAAILGTGPLADALWVAFKIPNFMRSLFAEGAFNAAFLPLYTRTRTGEGEEAATQMAREIHAVLLLVLIAFTVLTIIFMPQLMFILATGFEPGTEKFDLAVLFTRITMPYILFISLVSLQGGLLNSHGKFAAVAATPILMNLSMIFAFIVFTPHLPTAGHAGAYGILLAGVAQYFWLYYYCRKAGLAPKIAWPRMTPNVKLLLTLIGPAALGSSVTQISLLINTNMASHIPKAISVLSYAQRLSELPMGVIGVAVSTALLPMLARNIREGKIAEALHSQNRALELSFLFGIPAAVALMVIPYPIISVVFERGAFTEADTIMTYTTLMAYAAGVPAYLMVKIFASTFYANQETRTPMQIAVVCVAINVVCNLLFMDVLGPMGFALSTTIAGWVNAMCLGFILHRRALFITDPMFRFRVTRIIASALVMGALLWPLWIALSSYFHQGFFLRLCVVLILILWGAMIYAGVLLGLKATNLQEVRQYFRKAP